MLFGLGLGALALDHVRDGAGNVCAHAAYKLHAVARSSQLLKVDHSVANDVFLDHFGLLGHELLRVAARANKNSLTLALLLVVDDWDASIGHHHRHLDLLDDGS